MPIRRSPALARDALLLALLVLLSPASALAQVDGAAIHAQVTSSEAYWLLASCALLLVLPQLYANAASLKFGVPAALGNREAFPELTGWLGRARRAELNLQTNLIPFAAVVLLLEAAHLSTGLSRTGAAVFFLGRLVHALAYLLGIPGVRTLGFYAGLAGTILAALPLLTAV